MAYEFRLAMSGVQRATGQPIGEYVVLGGGSNSELWCQILADVLGTPVVRARSVEATCLGAGVLGAYGAGWYDSGDEAAAAMTEVGKRFEPDERAAGTYDELFGDVYEPLYEAAAPQLRRLAQIRTALADEQR